MKYCEEFAALLDPYVDGELSGEEAARVRDHLATCPGCRSYVDDALALRAAFPDVEETAVPEDFAAGVMEAVRALEAAKEKRAPSGRRGKPHWKTVLLPLAACFALAVLVRTVPGGGRDKAAVSTASMAPADADLPAGSGAPYALESAPQTAEAWSAKDSADLEEAPETPAPEGLSPAPAARDASAPADAPADAPAANDSASPEAANGYLAAAAPAAGEKMSRMAAFRAIRLTAAEAGDLLADLPCTEEDGSRCYQLTEAEFDALLEALAEQGITPPEEKPPETEVLPEGYGLVYVTEE